MKNNKLLLLIFLLIALTSVYGVPIDWGWTWSKTTSEATITTTEPQKLPNNLLIGECEEDDNVKKNFISHHF